VKRVILSLLAVAAVFAALAGGVSTTTAKANRIVDTVSAYQHITWKWQRLMGVRLTKGSSRERVALRAHRSWIRNLWYKRAHTAWRHAQNPPHESAWECIHRYEGAWTDSGAPYYGGLQMDLSFQQAYGGDLLRRKGTADHWSPTEQMWVAERAYRAGRGFYPWPNTARYCGLI
jgi:hypothetical protein